MTYRTKQYDSLITLSTLTKVVNNDSFYKQIDNWNAQLHDKGRYS